VDATVKFSGDRLRSARLARGLTQAELAHRAHVRERQIIRWENDQHVPRVESISTLARALKVTVAELLAPEPEGAEEDDVEADPVSDLLAAIRSLVRLEAADVVRAELARQPGGILDLGGRKRGAQARKRAREAAAWGRHDEARRGALDGGSNRRVTCRQTFFAHFAGSSAAGPGRPLPRHDGSRRVTTRHHASPRVTTRQDGAAPGEVEEVPHQARRP
jgi:transcriptional regulator with XRE-family HTH domain